MSALFDKTIILCSPTIYNHRDNVLYCDKFIADKTLYNDHSVYKCVMQDSTLQRVCTDRLYIYKEL